MPDAGNWTNGIDEVRFRAQALSQAHLLAEYRSWTSPATFFGEGQPKKSDATDFGVVAVPDVATTYRNQAVTVSPLDNDYDPEGGALTLSSLGTATGGTASLNPDGTTVRFVPTANFTGTGSFNYTAADPQGNTSASRVTVTVTAPPGATVYEWGMPWIPALDADIDIAYIPTNGTGLQTATGAAFTSLGSPTKMLLIVAPNNAVTGRVAHTNLKYRGVVLIGATFTPLAASTSTINGASVGGLARLLQLDFDQAGGWAAGKPPFLWVSNLSFTASATKFGDILRTGTTANATGTNIGDFMDLYCQKWRVPNGHYGGDTGTGDGGFSDVVQRLHSKSTRHCYFADMDLRWGYTTFGTAPNNLARPEYPDGTLNFRRIVCRPMPADTVAPFSTLPQPIYLQFLDGTGAADLTAGRYLTHNISDFHCAAGTTSTAAGSYFGATGLTEVLDEDLTPDTIYWTHTKPTNRAFRLYEGDPINFHATETTLPSYVSASDVGHALRVTTPAQLRAIFPNASST